MKLINKIVTVFMSFILTVNGIVYASPVKSALSKSSSLQEQGFKKVISNSARRCRQPGDVKRILQAAKIGISSQDGERCLVPPSDELDKAVVDFYRAMTGLCAAADKKDERAFNRIRAKMIGLLAGVRRAYERGEDVQAAYDRAMQKGVVPEYCVGGWQELIYFMDIPLGDEHWRIIKEAIAEAEGVLYKGNVEQTARELLSRTKNICFANCLPEFKKIDPGILRQFSGAIAELTSNMTVKEMLAFTSYVESDPCILLDVDIRLLKGVYIHEMMHYLSAQGKLAMPADNEYIHQAIPVCQAIKDHGREILSVFSESCRKSFACGYELASRGEYTLDPEEIQRLTLEMITNEAEAAGVVEHGQIFQISQETLQRAGGEILAGIITFRAEQEAEFPYLRYLKEYGERIFNPMLTREEEERADRIIAEIRPTVDILLGLIGKRVEIVPWRRIWPSDRTPRWRYVEELNEFHYVSKDLVKHSAEAAKGLFLQEAVRILSTDLDSIDQRYREQNLFMLLYTTLQASRSVFLRSQVFSGLYEQVMKLYEERYDWHDPWLAELELAQLPIHIQFLEACLYHGWLGEEDPRIKSEKVAQMVKATQEAREQAINENDDRLFFIIVRDQIWPYFQQLYKKAKGEELCEKAVNEVLAAKKLAADSENKHGIRLSLRDFMPDFIKQALQKLLKDIWIRKKLALEMRAELHEAEGEFEGRSFGEGSLPRATRKTGETSARVPVKPLDNLLTKIQKIITEIAAGRGEDTSGLEEELARLRSELDENLGDFKNTLAEISEAAGRLGAKAQELSVSSGEAQEAAGDLANEANRVQRQAGKGPVPEERGGELTACVERVDSQSEEMTELVNQFEQLMRTLAREADAAFSGTREAEEINQSTQSLKQIGEQLGRLAGQFEEGARDLKDKTDNLAGRLGEDITHQITAVRGLAQKLQELAQQLQQIAGEIQADAQQSQAKCADISGQADRLGREMVTGATTGVGGETGETAAELTEQELAEDIQELKDLLDELEQPQKGAGVNILKKPPRVKRRKVRMPRLRKLWEKIRGGGKKKQAPPQAPAPKSKELPGIFTAIDEAQQQAMGGLTMEEWDYFERLIGPFRYLVNSLATALALLYEKDQIRRFLTDLPTGDEIAEESLANIKTTGDIFGEETLPKESKVRISFVIDMSGSMSGEYFDDALRGLGLLLLAISGHKNLDVEISGFSDAIVPILEYGEFLDENMIRKKIYEAAQKFVGGGTRDVSAVTAAIKRMRVNDAMDTKKIMFIISDGDSGERGHQTLIHSNPDIKMFMVGIGGDCREVEGTFGPNGIYLPSVTDIYEKLRGVIERELRAPAATILTTIVSMLLWLAIPLLVYFAAQAVGMDNGTVLLALPLYLSRIGKIAGLSAEEKTLLKCHRAMDIREAGEFKVKTVSSGRIGKQVIQIGDIEIEPPASPQFPLVPQNIENLRRLWNILRYSRAGPNPLLQGEAGTGKSIMVRYLGEVYRAWVLARARQIEDPKVREMIMEKARNFSVRVITFHEGMKRPDVTQRLGIGEGGEKDKTGYVNSELIDGRRNGDWIVLSEVNRAIDEVRNELNDPLASGRKALDDGTVLGAGTVLEQLRRRDYSYHSRFIATQNPPKVQTGGRYKGFALSGEFLDRFRVLNIKYLPPLDEFQVLKNKAPGLDEMTLKKLVLLANLIRSAFNPQEYPFPLYELNNLFAGEPGARSIFAAIRGMKERLRVPLLHFPLTTRALVKVARHLSRFPDDRKRVRDVLRRHYWIDDLVHGAGKKVMFASFVDLLFTYQKRPLVNRWRRETKEVAGVTKEYLVMDYDDPDDKQAKELSRVEIPLSSGGALVPDTELEDAPENREKIYELLQDIILRNPILNIGEAGTGKNHFADFLGRLQNKEVLVFGCSPGTKSHHLYVRRGYGEVNAGETSWVDAMALKYMRRGSLVVFDEGNKAPPGILVSLNDLLQDKEVLLPSGETFRLPPGTIIAINMNPPRAPYEVYDLSGEFLDRFSVHEFVWLPAVSIKRIMQERFPELSYAFISSVVDCINIIRTFYADPRALTRLSVPVTMCAIEAVLDEASVSAESKTIRNIRDLCIDACDKAVPGEREALYRAQELKEFDKEEAIVAGGDLTAALKKLEEFRTDPLENIQLGLEAVSVFVKYNERSCIEEIFMCLVNARPERAWEYLIRMKELIEDRSLVHELSKRAFVRGGTLIDDKGHLITIKEIYNWEDKPVVLEVERMDNGIRSRIYIAKGDKDLPRAKMIEDKDTFWEVSYRSKDLIVYEEFANFSEEDLAEEEAFLETAV